MPRGTAQSWIAVAALATALAGCRPRVHPPSPGPLPKPLPAQAVCIEFEPPLVSGTQYGQPSLNPGDIAFTTNNVPVYVREFTLPGGGKTFNVSYIDSSVVVSSGQSIRLNNIALQFRLTIVGFDTRGVTFEFLDKGGVANLSVNGIPNPPFVGKVANAPNPIGGAALAVAATSIAGGTRGTITLTSSAPIGTVEIGGQELWIDHVCLSP